MNTSTLAPELPQTLAKAAAALDLFAKCADALRGLEADERVTHVVVSPNRGEIVVLADDYTHIALRVVA